MKLTVSAALFLLAVLQSAHGGSLKLTPEMRASLERTSHGLNSIVAHTNYLTRIEAAWVTNAPSWKLEMENPPLSARTALQKAREELGRIRTDATEWNFQSLTLKSFTEENWYYVAEYSRVSDQQYEPGCYYFDSIRIAVAMNGKTLTPDLTSQQNAEHISRKPRAVSDNAER